MRKLGVGNNSKGRAQPVDILPYERLHGTLEFSVYVLTQFRRLRIISSIIPARRLIGVCRANHSHRRFSPDGAYRSDKRNALFGFANIAASDAQASRCALINETGSLEITHQRLAEWGRDARRAVIQNGSPAGVSRNPLTRIRATAGGSRRCRCWPRPAGAGHSWVRSRAWRRGSKRRRPRRSKFPRRSPERRFRSTGRRTKSRR